MGEPSFRLLLEPERRTRVTVLPAVGSQLRAMSLPATGEKPLEGM